MFDPKSLFSMAEKLPFGEGASINRPPLFCGLNYQFWKVRMKIFVQSLCTDQVVGSDDVAASGNIGVLNGTPD